MFPYQKLLELLKLPLRVNLGIALSSGVVLFLSYIGELDLEAFKPAGRPIVIIVFVVSSVFTSVGIVDLLLAPIRDRQRQSRLSIRRAVRRGEEEERRAKAEAPVLARLGHLGRLNLAMIAARKVDKAACRICDAARAMGWTTIFVADHGNADRVETSNGQPYGLHTDRPVPLIVVPSAQMRAIWRTKEGSLANVAATVLASLDQKPPPFMHPSLLDFQLRESTGP